MHDDATCAGATGRGRIVMLVDNGVRGDSRVQKTARSAAEAGWEVALLGVARGGQPESWSLGPARVRLLPMPDPLARASVLRRTALRWFLRRPAPAATPAPHVAPGAAAAPGEPAPPATRDETPVPGAAPVSPRARRGARANVFAVARRVYRPWDRARTWFWLHRDGDAAWRRLEPGLWDYEVAFGPVIDRLAPDLIHAHDFRMLGVGARAKQRAAAGGRRVRLVWDAHEFLPGVRPWRDNPRWLPAHRAYEREYAHHADAVITVSEALAGLLVAEHGLADRPTVVLNAPATDHRALDDPAPDLRATCGLDAGTRLVVYSGKAAPQRGLALMVEALPELPGVHVALVVDAAGAGYARALLARAARLGVADRLHVLPYVPHWRVVPFLAAADAGVIPIQHWPNHEIALITKFFEYSQARLPLVVSDVRAMAETVRATGQGEVFRADDVDDYVRAVRAVLADPERYRAAYDKPGLLDAWTWQAQATVLDGVYRRLVPDRVAT